MVSFRGGVGADIRRVVRADGTRNAFKLCSFARHDFSMWPVASSQTRSPFAVRFWRVGPAASAQAVRYFWSPLMRLASERDEALNQLSGRVEAIALSPERLDERISQWVEFVNAKAAECGIERLQLISDTVFTSAPSTVDGLGQMVRFARIMLSDGLINLFPIRGAIVHGAYSWGSLLYGPAVIEAHELEVSQNWIGVACTPGLPHVDAMWALDKLICYSPPLKSGPIKSRPVVSWQIPSTSDLAKFAVRSSSMQDGEILTGELGEKINNTAQLALYQRFLRLKNGNPAQFYGLVPVHALESLLPPVAP
jgi:hypothetical protein